jgi:hypothetical protein
MATTRHAHLRLVARDGETIAEAHRPEQPRPKTDDAKQDREIICGIIEEHLSSLEKASLILAYCLKRQRTLLDELKAAEGGDWQVDAAPGLFGDACLFQDLTLRLAPCDDTRAEG